MKPTRYYSKRQENEIAKEVGGRRIKNSGANKFSKGDVRTGPILIEAKTPTKEVKSFAIKEDWLEKNRHEAFEQGYDYGALCFQFKPGGKKYYVVDISLFGFILEALEGKKENK